MASDYPRRRADSAPRATHRTRLFSRRNAAGNELLSQRSPRGIEDRPLLDPSHQRIVDHRLVATATQCFGVPAKMVEHHGVEANRDLGLARPRSHDRAPTRRPEFDVAVWFSGGFAHRSLAGVHWPSTPKSVGFLLPRAAPRRQRGAARGCSFPTSQSALRQRRPGPRASAIARLRGPTQLPETPHHAPGSSPPPSRDPKQTAARSV